MVVAFGADEPFGLPDQMVGVRGVHADIRLAVVVYQFGLIDDVLRGVWSKVFASIRGSVARRLPGVAVYRAQIACVRNFRRIAAGLLCRGENIEDMIGLETICESSIRLRALGNRLSNRAGHR